MWSGFLLWTLEGARRRSPWTSTSAAFRSAENAAPAPGGPASPSTPTCVWVDSADPARAREVAEELARRLRERGAVVTCVTPEPPPNGSRHSPGLDEVGALASRVTNGAPNGLIVVGCPLRGPREGALIRSRIPRLVEVRLRGAEDQGAGLRVPVIYRTMEWGQVVERVITSTPERLWSPPEVVVNGTLGSPHLVAAGLADTLERSGWFVRPPGNPTGAAVETGPPSPRVGFEPPPIGEGLDLPVAVLSVRPTSARIGPADGIGSRIDRL